MPKCMKLLPCGLPNEVAVKVKYKENEQISKGSEMFDWPGL